MKIKLLYLCFAIFLAVFANAQDISLYEQFNGRYDFTFVGNTLNPSENNSTPTCTIFTSSSADLNLNPNDQVIAAYLYWAGSGTGDFDIQLNGTPVSAQRTFPLSALNTDGQTRDYFSAFADVTSQVQATGNGTYTVSELDLTAVVSLPLYCGIKTNFGGWAIIVFYYNPNLPLNQLNLYDGLQYVPTAINITLPSLNVIDNVGAKIGFLAWEGDAGLAINETLSINGNALSNSLNPVNNAFNGTNTITGSNTLYNMDLDVYDIQNNIAIGDETADITLQSGQDFVMINAIVTKLNSQLPDATISIDNTETACNTGTVELNYTVYNVNSTEVLPASTPIAFYIQGNLVGTAQTTVELPIGGSQSGTIVLNIPPGTPVNYEILALVDDQGNGLGGIVTETNEDNNFDFTNEILLVSPPLGPIANITLCETGGPFAIFDFSAYQISLKNQPTDTVTFYTSAANANIPQNQIINPGAFQATANPQQIFVRLQNAQGCYSIGSFLLITDDCLYPDGSIVINSITNVCDSRNVTIQYTVNNFNSDDFLPSGTPVAIYSNGVFIASTITTANIPIGGSLNGTVVVTVPGTAMNLNITIAIDDTGNGSGIVTEINENNNTASGTTTLRTSPVITQVLPNLTECETANGSNVGIFDFSGYISLLQTNPGDVVTFYTSQNNANLGLQPITNPGSYTSVSNPQTIYVRLQSANGCYDTATFTLTAVDCLFPDATVVITDIIKRCDSRTVTVKYTVNNFNSFDVLPAGNPIAIYLNNVMVVFTSTTQQIPVGGSLNATITLSVPASAGLNFTVTIIVDDLGNGTGEVVETDETNNSDTESDTLWVSPVLPLQPADITVCETANGSGIGVFNFSGYTDLLQVNDTDIVTFHTSQDDAINGEDAILNPDNYTSATNPQTIFVRLTDVNGCYDIGSFNLIAVDCLFPDGVVEIQDILKTCDSRSIIVNYLVTNPNSFDILPAGTSIAIYINGNLLTTTVTQGDIPVNGNEAGSITLLIPDNIPLDFEITVVIDPENTVQETIEDNNSTNYNDVLWVSPVLQQPTDITECETKNGSGIGLFDFSAYAESLKNSATDAVTFYETLQNAIDGVSLIENPESYTSNANPQTIYVRLEDANGCFTTGQFNLIAVDCLFPDATVSLGDVNMSCNSRTITVTYTVNNFNSFDVLPAGTPVSIYANGQFIDYTETLMPIPVGGSEGGTITLNIPANIPLDFELTFVADDNGEGVGIVTEMAEDNNTTSQNVALPVSPQLEQPQDIVSCNIGYGVGVFDFSEYEQSLQTQDGDHVYFYTSQADANQDSNRIYNTSAFNSTANPQQLFVRVDNGTCYSIASFMLTTRKCPPVTYNYVTPNGDGYNDTFFVEGLRNIFLNFKISIYNRWGSLVWTGNHNTEDWNGVANVEKVGPEGNTVPVGTYYFVLELNDPEYPEPIVDWVYVTK